MCCHNWAEATLVLLMRGFVQNGSTIGIICESGKKNTLSHSRTYLKANSVERTTLRFLWRREKWSALKKKFKVCKAWVSFQNCPEYSLILPSNFVNIFTMVCFCFVPRCGKISHVNDTKLINFPGSQLSPILLSQKETKDVSCVLN